MNLIPELLAGRDAGRDGPDLPRVQPVPLYCLVAHVAGHTAITRLWDDGDTRRCRLCPKCHAVEDTCLVVATRHVPERDCDLFDANPTGGSRR